MAFFSSVLSLLLYSCRYCYFYLDCNYFITPLRRKTCRNEEFMCAIINNATFPHLHTNYVNAIRTAFIPLQWIDSLFFCPISLYAYLYAWIGPFAKHFELIFSHYFELHFWRIASNFPEVENCIRVQIECVVKIDKTIPVYAHNSWKIKKVLTVKLERTQKHEQYL